MTCILNNYHKYNTIDKKWNCTVHFRSNIPPFCIFRFYRSVKEELLLLNFYKIHVILFPIKDQFDTQYVYKTEYNTSIKVIVFWPFKDKKYSKKPPCKLLIISILKPVKIDLRCCGQFISDYVATVPAWLNFGHFKLQKDLSIDKSIWFTFK